VISLVVRLQLMHCEKPVRANSFTSLQTALQLYKLYKLDMQWDQACSLPFWLSKINRFFVVFLMSNKPQKYFYLDTLQGSLFKVLETET